MKRATPNPSFVFRNVLEQAEDQLELDSQAARNFGHRGIRGDERAATLRAFLDEHLPGVFKSGKGEAMDYLDTRSGQLDLFVYDAVTASPIQVSGENILLPAESLYAVIEVKSILSKPEVHRSLDAAKKIRLLRPFKKKFSAPPQHGAAPPNTYRCPYFLFAYTSDLSATDWAQKEYDRLKAESSRQGCPMDLIDRILVLDRGLIRPQEAVARIREQTQGIFLDFYIHLMNFLARERKRRPAIDWTAYSAKGKWIKLAP